MTLTTVAAALAVLSPAFAAPKAPAKETSSRASSSRVVLGKLGQTTQSTPIYTSPLKSSRVYYTAKPKDYLVVRRTRSSAWLQVLMQNGRYGYVSKRVVQELPYEVTGSKGGRTSTGRSTTGMLASRGGPATAMATDYAMNFQGTPYVWGGNDPLRGIDCSAFVKSMFGQFGMSLPRTAAEQALVGKPIYRLEHLQTGDRLYCWDKKRGKIGHTGIYMGNGYFVHSSSGKGGVGTDYLTDRWLRILVAARR